MDQPLSQKERLLQALIEKNNEIAKLRKLMNAGADKTAEKSPLEKSMWAMLYVLCEKFVKCEKCGDVTKPATNKHNYMLAQCTKCRHYMTIKRSKAVAFNAYYDNFKRAPTWMIGKI